MTFSHRIIAPLVIVLATTVACEDSSQQTRWEGEFVTVTSPSQLEPCGGTVAFLDRFVAHNYQYWTGEPALELSLELDVRMPETDTLATDGQAFSAQGFAWIDSQNAVLHEISHLVVGAADGSSAPALSEGIAEVFGKAESVGQWGPVSLEPAEFLFLPRSEFEGRHYVPAAQLVGFWIRRFGVETVRAAFVAVGREDPPEQTEQALLSVFGDDFYDSLDDFVQSPQCGLQAWECGDSVLPTRTLPILLERATDCRQDPELYGFVGTEGKRWHPQHAFVVDFPEDTSFVLDTTDNAVVRFDRCIATCADKQDNDLTLWGHGGRGNTVFDMTYAAGRYTVTVEPLDAAEPFSVSMR